MPLIRMSCCGLREMKGAGGNESAREKILDIFRTYYLGSYNSPNFSHIIITQAGRGARYGEILSNYIKRNKLGVVSKSTTKTNPNSGNPITVYVWALHQAAVKKWLQKERSKR